MRREITNRSIYGKCLMDGVIVAFSNLSRNKYLRGVEQVFHNLWRECIKAISNFAMKLYNLM